MFTSDREIIALGIGSFLVVCIAAKLDFLDNPTALSLIALTGSLLALRKYIYEKEKHRRDTLTDLVKFYREEILPESQWLIDEIQKKGFKYTLLKLDSENIGILTGKYPFQTKEQMKITKNDNLYSHQTLKILNKLEEFSLRTINNSAVDDDILIPVKRTFVHMVESNAVALLRQRQIETGGETYSKTLELYYYWRGGIDDLTAKDRMTKDWVNLYNSV